MTTDKPSAPEPRLHFSLRSILYWTVAAACIFGAVTGLVTPLNELSAISLAAVALVVYLLGPIAWRGIALGSGLFALLGPIVDPFGAPGYFWQCLFAWTSMGAGLGSAIEALLAKRYGLGLVVLYFVLHLFFVSLPPPEASQIFTPSAPASKTY